MQNNCLDLLWFTAVHDTVITYKSWHCGLKGEEKGKCLINLITIYKEITGLIGEG